MKRAQAPRPESRAEQSRASECKHKPQKEETGQKHSKSLGVSLISSYHVTCSPYLAHQRFPSATVAVHLQSLLVCTRTLPSRPYIP